MEISGVIVWTIKNLTFPGEPEVIMWKAKFYEWDGENYIEARDD